MGTKKNGTSAVLMELIMVTGFFIFCAGIALLVYLKANSLSHLAAYTDQATVIASNMAEDWKADAFTEEAGTDGVLIVYYDNSNVRCSETDAVFTGSLTQTTNAEEHIAKAEIEVIETKRDRTLVTIQARKIIH